jgi:hypothetical protein
VGYEGGPDTFGLGSISSKKSANLDPRMLITCRNYMNAWYGNGGELMMWFMAGAGNWDTQYGAWELTTNIADNSAPKIQCMDQVLAAKLPAPTARHQIPGTFNAIESVGNFAPYSSGSITNLRYLHTGSYVDYLLFSPSAGNYTLVLNAAVGQSGNKLDIAVNNVGLAVSRELTVTGWATPADQPGLALSLPKGYSTLRVKTAAETTGFDLKTISLR